jgi:hypothetical protein
MAAMPYPAYGVRTSGFRRWPALPDGGDALSGLRSAHVRLSALACFAEWRRCVIRPTECACGFRRRPVLPDGGDALSGLQILPDGGGALSGLQSASSACEMKEVAVKRRPDKRSAIRQKCAAQKKPRHWRGSL